MLGREVDSWERNEVSRAGVFSINPIVDAGFQGIYVDMVFFKKDRKNVDLLKEMVDPNPLTTSDGQLLFFDLSKYDRRAWSLKR